MMLVTGEMYVGNRIGQSMDSCGTPQLNIIGQSSWSYFNDLQPLKEVRINSLQDVVVDIKSCV